VTILNDVKVMLSAEQNVAILRRKPLSDDFPDLNKSRNHQPVSDADAGACAALDELAGCSGSGSSHCNLANSGGLRAEDSRLKCEMARMA
jgi:hypothetical protein